VKTSLSITLWLRLTFVGLQLDAVGVNADLGAFKN